MARRGRSRRSGRRGDDASTGFQQLPFRNLRIPYPPFEILPEEDVERIHEASLDVLEEIGINFLLDEARDILEAAGANVEAGGTRVRFDRRLIEELVAKAPSTFTAHARNPAHNLEVGGTPSTSSSSRARPTPTTWTAAVGRGTSRTSAISSASAKA